MYFLHGALPWQGLKAATKKQKYDWIMEKKMTMPTDLLCWGFLSKFGIFLNYTCALHFDDKLDYSYLHKLFCDLFVCEGFSMPMFSTGVFSMEPRRKVVDRVPKQVLRDIRSSRKKMNTVQVTGCKFNSHHIFFWDNFWLTMLKLHSHTRQAQQGAPARLSMVQSRSGPGPDSDPSTAV